METFKFLAISDIHLGHSRTKTSFIINNLKTVINRDILSEIDMLIIAGDLFDHAICYSDDSVFEIQKWLIYLINLCSLNDVSIRILEGTPLHDRNQAKHVRALSSHLKSPVDILYVDKVWVEKNEKYGLNLLYVPDEWKPDPDQTWLDVKEELSSNGLEKVDLSIMHGMFEHQVPIGCKVKPHSNSRYESITDRYIIVGHVHHPTFYGKIIAPGSFDRLKHGNEESKGCWKVAMSKSRRSDKITFMENVNAKEYISVDCRKLSFDAAIEKLSSIDAKPDSFIKIVTNVTDNTWSILEWCKKKYFNYNWSSVIKDNSVKRNVGLMHKPNEVTSITPDSILPILSDKLKERNCKEEVKGRAMEIMKEIISNDN